MKKLSILVVVIIVAGIIISRSPTDFSETEVTVPTQPSSERQMFAGSGVVNRSPTLTATVAVTGEETLLEKKELYRNLEQLFVERLPTVVDPRQLRPQLSAINAQGGKAVQMMFAGLRSAETPVTTRLAIVDYFRYRLRWDDRLSDLVLDYIAEELATDSQQFQALVMADKAELLGAIAKRDRLLARQVAETIDRPLFRNIVSYEIYHALLEVGEESATAQRFVRSFHRQFKL